MDLDPLIQLLARMAANRVLSPPTVDTDAREVEHLQSKEDCGARRHLRPVQHGESKRVVD